MQDRETALENNWTVPQKTYSSSMIQQFQFIVYIQKKKKKHKPTQNLVNIFHSRLIHNSPKLESIQISINY